jgi:UDP-N-acetylmuramyl pentapeptide phosphotransferase/UDP-N-acetylglucosamine-1-phosphate transferase
MTPPMMTWFTGLLVAFLAAALLTARLATWLVHLGVVDDVAGGRNRPRSVPRGGGLAIIAVVLAAASLVALRDAPAATRALAALMPAVAVAAVSWRDDLLPLPATLRLGVHIAAAITAVLLLGPVRRIELGALGTLDLGPAAWPLSVLWIVGMTNAFNFMDGIDGIAGITAMAVGAAVAAAAVLLGAVPVAVVAAALAAASGGFLTGNWSPARIFMGDVGSTFCGFLLATLPLAVPDTAVPRAVPVAALAAWPFLLDTGVTLVRRLCRGENVLRPHRSHFYQRLAAAGWSHRAVASLYGGLAAFAGAIAVAPLCDPASRDAATGLAVATPIVGASLIAGLVLATERGHRGSVPAATLGRER